jgi:multidrug efflux pump subunit AcrB
MKCFSKESVYMKKILHYLIRQKLLVGLLVALVAAAGIISLTSLNRESIPDVALDMVTITTIYPGASSSDMEVLVSIPIEKKLRKVSDLDKVRSYNVDNVSVIVIYIDDSAKDTKKAVQDIKDAVDQVDNLPARAEKPLVKEITTDIVELVSVAFTGKTEDVPYSRLREFANLSENFFYEIDGIAQIDKYGYLDREYLVEVDPAALERYRIGINSIVGTLAARNVDFPGGPLRIGKKEFVLRTKGQFSSADDIRDTVIMGNDIGRTTRIRDVAKVTDTYKEADQYRRFNGQPAVIYKLSKKKSADEIELSGRVHKAVESYSIPGYDDVKMTLFNDWSNMTKHRIASVLEEAAVGFVILGLFMLLLLGRRMSAIVLAGIPLSFLATFAVMKYMGITFNIISLFGMIMVLGMIVDFSIVVAENSHRYMERGLKRYAAIETGISEVFWAVTTTLICIITAFMPLLLVSGLVGKFIKPIPMVIIAALIISWFVAFFILPTYLNLFLRESHKTRKGKTDGEQTIPMRIAGFISRHLKRDGRSCKKGRKSKTGDICREDENYEKGGFGRVQQKYKRFVSFALRHRYGVLILLLVLFGGSLVIVPKIGFKFMTGGGEEEMRIIAKMPHETNLGADLEEMLKLEKIILTTPKEELIAVHAWIGEEWAMAIDPKPGKATYKNTFEMYLPPEKDRERTAEVIANELRGKIDAGRKRGELSRDVEIKLECIAKQPPIGKPVNVEIRGSDYEVIKKIAKEYTGYLGNIKGIRDLSMDLEEGKTEYRYGIHSGMAAWSGVSVYDIAITLNASFSGAEATVVNRDQEEQKVRVRFEETARSKMSGLRDVKVTTRTGGLVPLDAVSTVKIEKEYSQINRLNYRRLVQVQADTDVNVITPVEVTKLLENKFADIEKRYPGYLITYGGEQEDTNKSMGELGSYFLAALAIIFVVITIFFRSFIMPCVVMIAIPFALVGVVFAHLLHGQPLSFMSMLGLFSLAGIIVSNTLVLVQFINKFRDEGLGLKEAIAEGGVVRLRPIILTAGSMVLELMPVIYGVGGKDYMVAPLALAFGYGLVFATFITLIIIPCFYHIAEDMKGAVSRITARFGFKMSPMIYRPAAEDED